MLLGVIFLLLCRIGAVGASRERFPNRRLLSSHLKTGAIDDFLHIQLSDRRGLEFQLGSMDVEQLALDDAAEQILNQLPQCTAYTRLFRHAGKFEEEHIRAGLNRWYEFHCPPDEKGDDVLKGQGTFDAIEQLMFLDEETVSLQSAFAISIEYLEPAYVIDDDPTLLPIEHRHTILQWSSLSNDVDNATVVHQRALNAYIPNDPLLNKQNHYDAINLRDAWKFMEETNSWSRAKDVIVHVCDSGWDLSHEDLGGKYFS